MDKYKISLTIELDLKKVYLNLVTHTEKGLKRTLIEAIEKTILDDYGADLGTIVSEKEKEAICRAFINYLENVMPEKLLLIQL